MKLLHILKSHSLKSIDKINARDMVYCGSSFKSDTKVIYTHSSSQYAFYDCQIQVCSLVMWLITAINKSWRMDLTEGTSWRMLNTVEIQSKSSHTTNCRFEIKLAFVKTRSVLAVAMAVKWVQIRTYTKNDIELMVLVTKTSLKCEPMSSHEPKT